jgi:hypothetical protein
VATDGQQKMGHILLDAHTCIPCHLQISRQIDVGVHDRVINYYRN